jgi:hypothetical protein
MKLTDERIIKMIRKANISMLEDDIRSYPDAERDGRTDAEFARDEAEYFIECYEEDGHSWNEDLSEARYILRRTDYGKRIPISVETFRPLPQFTPQKIAEAKATVNEYGRLKRLHKRLGEIAWNEGR